MIRGVVIALVAMVLALPIAAHFLLNDDLGTYRFRLTLSVNTPEGVREASSVLEVSYGMSYAIGRGKVSTHKLKGEATFLDLGQGRNVVMLLAHGPRGDNSDLTSWLPPVALLKKPWGAGSAEALKAGRKLEGTVELGDLLIPTMVSFADLSNPASASVVYAVGNKVECIPASNCVPRVVGLEVVDRFTGLFGPGYVLNKVTLEMVPAGVWPLNSLGIWGTPVSRGIERKMVVAFTKVRELDKTLQLVNPNDALRVRTGHLSIQ